MNTPGVDIQRFYGDVGTTLVQWKTWTKPRGAKFVYMIGVGGASSGGNGTNTATSSGGGAGGGSGAQSNLFIPAQFLPDVLYIQAGNGGKQPATLVSAAAGVAGTITYVAFEPNTTLAAQLTVLFASPGTATGAAQAAGIGGTGGTAAVIATIANMPLAGRGHYQFFAGQSGSAGGSNVGAPGVAQTYPTTGLMVMGGAGGAGSGGGVVAAGGAITGVGFGDNYPTIPGGLAPVISSTPGGPGAGGTMLKPFLYTGGTGGGNSTLNVGITAGAGGNGAPGCGGGGAGGSNSSTPTLARPGDGGPGFVIIMSW
jgi:hypothetical protein